MNKGQEKKPEEEIHNKTVVLPRRAFKQIVNDFLLIGSENTIAGNFPQDYSYRREIDKLKLKAVEMGL